MTEWNRSIQGSFFMGHHSVPNFMRLSIISEKKKNSHCTISNNFDLSISTVHNTIKRLKDSGKITLCKGQGWKLLLNDCDLWALRQHCMWNHHADEYTHLNTVCCNLRQSASKSAIRNAKRRLCINSVQKCWNVKISLTWRHILNQLNSFFFQIYLPCWQ